MVVIVAADAASRGMPEALMERSGGLEWSNVKAEAVGVDMAEGGREGEMPPPAAESWRLDRRVVRNATMDFRVMA